MKTYKATLSLHSFPRQDADLNSSASLQDHLDLFVDVDGESFLKTYETSIKNKDEFLNGKPISFTPKTDHRRIYMDYEGSISSNRGSVKILWKGHIQETETDVYKVIKS